MSNPYLSKFQIIGTSIKAFKIRNDFVSLGDISNIKRVIDVSHSVPTLELVNDGETYYGIVVLKIKTTVSSNKKKYIVDLTIEGCFNAPSELGENTFREMLKINGITSLYGIARGFVQSTTSQTLVSGSILLPMYNVAAYSKDLDAAETQDN